MDRVAELAATAFRIELMRSTVATRGSRRVEGNTQILASKSGTSGVMKGQSIKLIFKLVRFGRWAKISVRVSSSHELGRNLSVSFLKCA